MDGIQSAWSRQVSPLPSELAIHRRVEMMLLVANESQIGTAKDPIHCIFGQGGKGQPNIQSTENPLTW